MSATESEKQAENKDRWDLPIDVSELAQMGPVPNHARPPAFRPPVKSRLVVSSATRWTAVTYGDGTGKDQSRLVWVRRRRLAAVLALLALVVGGGLVLWAPERAPFAPSGAAHGAASRVSV